MRVEEIRRLKVLHDMMNGSRQLLKTATMTPYMDGYTDAMSEAIKVLEQMDEEEDKEQDKAHQEESSSA